MKVSPSVNYAAEDRMKGATPPDVQVASQGFRVAEPVTWFVGGDAGPWRVLRIDPVFGTPLHPVSRLEVLERRTQPRRSGWALRGVRSFERYVTRHERSLLEARQETLGRPSATRAALIPIRKSDRWWDLPQDERRTIFEERSHHIRVGLEYLPAVARRLYHGHDLGEPFDFLTWFEYAPDRAASFEELVGRLRKTDEWSYVVREVDIRLAWDHPRPAIRRT